MFWRCLPALMLRGHLKGHKRVHVYMSSARVGSTFKAPNGNDNEPTASQVNVV